MRGVYQSERRGYVSKKLLYTAVFLVCAVGIVNASYRVVSQGPTTSPTVEVATEMAPAPVNCGSLPELMPVLGIGDAVGAWPLWTTMPSHNGRIVLAFPERRNHDNPELPGWWSTKVGWFIKKTYAGEVRLRGFNQSDNSPIYFDIGDNSTTTAPVIDPEYPGGFIDDLEDWAFFPSLLWVSKAGCYTIIAEWSGGMWSQTIPVGYVEGW
jgi:hypothetical protein